jgi:hypothetical protein
MPLVDQSLFDSVAFGIDGFPSSAEYGGESIRLVPMSVRLQLQSLAQGRRVIQTPEAITFEEHLELHNELERIWHNLSNMHPDIAYHKYDFVVLFANLLYWRRVIRKVLSETEPRIVFLPSRCKRNTSLVSSRDELLKWLLYQVLEEETLKYRRSYFTESTSTIPRTSSASLTFQTRHLAGLLLDLVQKLRATIQEQPWRNLAWLSAKSTDSRRNWRFQPARTWGTRVPVIAQYGKVYALLTQRGSGQRLKFVSYSRIERMFQTEIHRNFEEHYTSQTGSEEGLLNFLSCSVQQRMDSSENISKVAAGKWDVMLTDAQHHPYIRQLTDEAIELGKKVASVPEGAVAYVGELERFGGTFLFLSNPKVTHFVLNEAVKSSWIARGIPADLIHVSGFLGNTLRTGTLRNSLYRISLRGSISKFKSNSNSSPPTVLLSFDALLVDWAIPQFGHVSQSELLVQHLLVLEELLQTGHSVIVKTRDPLLNGYLIDMYKGKSALFICTIPWYILVKYADITLTRDSSIAWESIALRKPVIIWNFSDFPSFGEVTLKGIPDFWVRVVRDATALSKTVMELSDAFREMQETHDPNLANDPIAPIEPEVVMNWLANVGRSEARKA